MYRVFVCVFAFLLSAGSIAQGVTRFQNGQVADATAINENFDTILTAISLLQHEAGFLTGEGDPGASIGSDGDLS